MKNETLDMIINTLRLRMRHYTEESDTYKELKNTIDMLTASCYRLEG
mgnify:CR=1 FL=1